jgi:DNA-binding transcriptional LysR family regulator
VAFDLKLLGVFAAVAEHTSFSRAAEALGSSQPAVSRSVAQLENELGARLFERDTRNVELTRAGALLLDHARAILNSARIAADDLAGLRGLSTGTLRVGASTTIATYILPRFLARFYRTYPGVALHLVRGNTAEVVTRAIERDVDLAVVEGPVDDPRVHLVPWDEDEMIVHAFSLEQRTPHDHTSNTSFPVINTI